MCKKIHILLFFILLSSCKSKSLYVYVSNSNSIELKNLNYQINSDSLNLISDSISYSNVSPSNKKFVLDNLKKENIYFSVRVEGKVIKQILVNKYDKYLFLSIFYNEQINEFDVYYILSRKKILFK